MGAVMDTVKEFLHNPAYLRKAVAALVASVLSLVAAQLLPDAVAVWVYALQPLFVAAGVVVVPANAPKAGPPA